MEDMQPIDLNSIGPDTEPFDRDIENFSLNHSGTDHRVLAVKDSELDSRADRSPDVFTTVLGSPEFVKNLEYGITLSHVNSIRESGTNFKSKYRWKTSLFGQNIE